MYLLQIIAASGDSLAAAKKEIEVLKSLSHPNCCPLLNHATNLCSHHGSLAYNVLLVFPAYEVGTVASSEHLKPLTSAGSSSSCCCSAACFMTWRLFWVLPSTCRIELACTAFFYSQQTGCTAPASTADRRHISAEGSMAGGDASRHEG